MPICPSCGKTFSGFSFGSEPATECNDCRRAKPTVAAASQAANPRVISSNAAIAAGRTPIATYTLVGLNLLVYLAMGFSGASWTDPNIMDAVRWGADFGPVTLSGEWWRLFTSTFVHFGIIHIGFNMWCLWDLGRALEFLMGRRAFVVTYVVCGLTASMVSVAWDPWRVSAGASGAIFGVAGAFVSYLYFKKTPIPQQVVHQKLKSLGIFIAYNLFYGMRSGVDNSAHLGGLVAGLVLGAIFPPMVRALTTPATEPSPLDTGSSQDSRNTRIAATVALASVVVLGLAATRLRSANAAAVHYGSGVRAARAGHLDQASRELQAAVKADPKGLYALALLGQVELERGDPRAAISPLESAISLDADDVELENNLALAYLGAGRFLEANGEMGMAFTHNKKTYSKGFFVQGVAEDREGRLTIAEQHLREALQPDPKFYQALDALAQVEAEEGQLDQARQSYADALKIRPDDPVASANVAVLKVQGSAQVKASDLAPISIPYATLLVKSPAWPYYP